MTCDAAVRFRPVAACLERQDEERRPVVVLEPGHEVAALPDSGRAVQHQPGLAEYRRQILGQRIDHLAELGEDQQPLLAFGKLVADLPQTKKLAAVGGPVFAVAEKLAGVVAHLLQAQERAQHHAAPGDVDGRLHLPLHGPHDLPVELDLGSGQVAVASRLRLLGQVADDLAVGLQPAQDVGADQPAQSAPPRRASFPGATPEPREETVLPGAARRRDARPATAPAPGWSFPRPMSSARQAPRPSLVRKRNQFRPSC